MSLAFKASRLALPLASSQGLFSMPRLPLYVLFSLTWTLSIINPYSLQQPNGLPKFQI